MSLLNYIHQLISPKNGYYIWLNPDKTTITVTLRQKFPTQISSREISSLHILSMKLIPSSVNDAYVFTNSRDGIPIESLAII